MGRKKNIALLVTVQILLALLFLAAGLTAQQSAPASAQTAKKMVPDNPSEYTPPAQPIPYSHKKHLSFGMQCKDCHTNPEPGKLMTFPATSKCMECHVTIAKDSPSIRKLAEYAKSQKPIPWVRVYTVLPGVA